MGGWQANYCGLEAAGIQRVLGTVFVGVLVAATRMRAG